VLFIGEVYNPGLYRQFIASGFDYLYDKVGMYDALCDVLCHRRNTDAITWAWQQTDDIRQHMLYFLENHDELRLASDFLVGDGRKAVPALVVAALLHQNPFMFYFGQEWGEHGMDTEGFSGHDGRTTIFDYWSLNPSQGDQELKALYQRVLNIARSEKAVVKGQTFDLMYVNQQYCRQFAFLRKTGKDMLLVVVNFDDVPLDMQLMIPDHAYDYLEIQERAYTAHELLSDTSCNCVLIKGESVPVKLQARGAIVYKLS
jgi:glycosidase